MVRDEANPGVEGGDDSLGHDGEPFIYFFSFVPFVTTTSNTLQGDANGSIPTIQPTIGRPMFAASVPSTKVLFVSEACVSSGTAATYGLRSRVEAVRNCRNIGKKDMKFNDAMPKMRVDPESYVVEADGVVCAAEPAEVLPLSQTWFVY